MRQFKNRLTIEEAHSFVQMAHHRRLWIETAEIIFIEFGETTSVWRCLFCAFTGWDDLQYERNQLH